MVKKRVLWVADSSFLTSGYGVYSREILSRLHASGEYVLGEFGVYGSLRDLEQNRPPWDFYPAFPVNPEEEQAYHTHPNNEFGLWKFEGACLKFKPDVVCSIMDYWMMNYQAFSPFRPFYRLCWMPTVDAYPQAPEWLSWYATADALCTYSDWAGHVLLEQTAGRIQYWGEAPAGADFDLFKPHMNKEAVKAHLGIHPNHLVVGTVMRNQKRKLFPDLFQAFSEFLRNCHEDVARRAHLYCHTTYPDLGWDLAKLLMETGLGHKVYFSYSCKQCGLTTANFFQGALKVCPNCRHVAMTMPGAGAGISREVLAAIYNAFDVYVQYSTSEGQGMPQVEAAACGLPVLSVDYSAMSDIVRKLRGYPLKVLALAKESETGCLRAVPDSQDLIVRLNELLGLPAPLRRRKGFEARLGAQEHYQWDKAVNVWRRMIDHQGPAIPWDSPTRERHPPREIPNFPTAEQFVRWCFHEILGEPWLANTFMAQQLVEDLHRGKTAHPMAGRYYDDLSNFYQREPWHDFSRDDALNVFLAMLEKKNHWERERTK